MKLLKGIRKESPENVKKFNCQNEDRHINLSRPKRIYIEKDNGKKRPLGIPAYEDKLV